MTKQINYHLLFMELGKLTKQPQLENLLKKL